MLTQNHSCLWRSDRQRLPRHWHFLLALALALTTLLGVAVYRTPQAHASNADKSNPIIHWDQSMIYQGQNNGNPEGPVGETAVVHGTGFTANQALELVVVSGDSNSDATNCQPPSPGTSVLVSTLNTDASGNFNATFAWPAGVGETGKVRKNSICSFTTDSNNTLVSSRDDGPFTVLTDNKPTFTLSPASIAAGNSITVTGQNWVPAQPLNITIASCADCDPGSNNVASATTSSVGLSTGTFSVNVPIPATMAANNYVVNVTSQAGPLDAFHINGLGVKQLAITASTVTPTPTAAPSPSATAASTQTVTAAPTATTNSTTGSSNGSGNGLIMIILIIFAVLLLAIGGVIFFMLAQRKKQATAPATPPGPFGANQANQFNAQRTPVTPFPQQQPMSTPGQFGNATNNNGAYPGYSQPNQPWQGNPQSNPQGSRQGNPQSNAGFNNFQQNQPFQSQQGNYLSNQGMGQPGMHRQCIRCGSPLAPNASVCGVCGTRNPTVDPNDPTMAY